jgi:hypothetical protein
MGHAEIRVSQATDLEGVDAGPGYIHAFTQAHSHEEFEGALKGWLNNHEIELARIESVGPAHEMLDIDEKLLDAAIEAAKHEEPTAVFYLLEDPTSWDDDPDADLLRASVGRNDLVRFRYIGTEDWELGFVLGTSDGWALINAVDVDLIAIDGYNAVRLDQVVDAEVLEDDEFFWGRALVLKGEQPRPLGLPLDDQASILAAVRDSFPLIRLTRGDTGEDHVGRIADIGTDALILEGVSRSGEWVGREDYGYANIISIQFGKAYEAALARVVGV